MSSSSRFFFTRNTSESSSSLRGSQPPPPQPLTEVKIQQMIQNDFVTLGKRKISKTDNEIEKQRFFHRTRYWFSFFRCRRTITEHNQYFGKKIESQLSSSWISYIFNVLHTKIYSIAMTKIIGEERRICFDVYCQLYFLLIGPVMYKILQQTPIFLHRPWYSWSFWNGQRLHQQDLKHLMNQTLSSSVRRQQYAQKQIFPTIRQSFHKESSSLPKEGVEQQPKGGADKQNKVKLQQHLKETYQNIFSQPMFEASTSMGFLSSDGKLFTKVIKPHAKQQFEDEKRICFHSLEEEMKKIKFNVQSKKKPSMVLSHSLLFPWFENIENQFNLQNESDCLNILDEYWTKKFLPKTIITIDKKPASNVFSNFTRSLPLSINGSKKEQQSLSNNDNWIHYKFQVPQYKQYIKSPLEYLTMTYFEGTPLNQIEQIDKRYEFPIVILFTQYLLTFYFYQWSTQEIPKIVLNFDPTLGNILFLKQEKLKPIQLDISWIDWGDSIIIDKSDNNLMIHVNEFFNMLQQFVQGKNTFTNLIDTINKKTETYKPLKAQDQDPIIRFLFGCKSFLVKIENMYHGSIKETAKKLCPIILFLCKNGIDLTNMSVLLSIIPKVFKPNRINITSEKVQSHLFRNKNIREKCMTILEKKDPSSHDIFSLMFHLFSNPYVLTCFFFDPFVTFFYDNLNVTFSAELIPTLIKNLNNFIETYKTDKSNKEMFSKIKKKLDSMNNIFEAKRSERIATFIRT